MDSVLVANRVKFILILLLVLLCGGALLAPGSSGLAAVAENGANQIRIENFKDGGTLYYDLPLLKGTAPGSEFITIASGDVELIYQVFDSRWRGFFPLLEGENQLTITASSGSQAAFNLSYQPMTNERMVRMVYIMGSDSSGLFDAPHGTANTLSEAVPRLRLAGRMLQSMTAELFYEKGRPRRTFRLVADGEDVLVDSPHVGKTISELRDMTGQELWNYFYDELGEIPDRDNIIDMAIIADSHFEAETGKLYAHTALGGWRLALFGSTTLYSFPEEPGEIEAHFTDSALVEPYLNPELGRAREYWAAYTTSLGAMLHEIGHCFGLDHPENGAEGDIMARGFDFLNRLAVSYESGLGPIDPASVTMPRWTDQDIAILEANSWLEIAGQDAEPEPPPPDKIWFTLLPMIQR